MASITVYWAPRLSLLVVLFALVVIAPSLIIPEPAITLASGESYYDSPETGVLNLTGRALVVYPRFLEGLKRHYPDCPKRFLVMGGTYNPRSIIGGNGAFVITGNTSDELNAGLMLACDLNDYQHRWGELDSFQGIEWLGIQLRYEAESWGLMGFILNWSYDGYTSQLATLGVNTPMPAWRYRSHPLSLLDREGLEGMPLEFGN